MFLLHSTSKKTDGRENKSTVLKQCFLTSNASCEEIENDSSGDLGHGLENASGPCPFACAHAPVMLSGNVVSLQERRKS